MRIWGALAAAVAVCGLGVSAAHARTFYVLRANPDAWTIIDPEAIEGGPGSVTKKAWMVTVQRNLIPGPPPQAGYVRALNAYDCDGQRFRWISFQAFSRSGVALATRQNPKPDWEAVTSSSPMLVEWRLVCGFSAGDSVIAADSIAKVVVALMAAWDATIPAVKPSSAADPRPPARRDRRR